MNLPILHRQDGDAPFSKDPAQSFTMPARFYHDADIYELEKDAIFYKSWHYAGHVSQVAEARSYFTTSIHQQNIFVARGRDDEIAHSTTFALIAVTSCLKVPARRR